MKSVSEIILSSNDVESVNKEVPILSEFSQVKKKNTKGISKKPNTTTPITHIVRDEVQKRYEFSNYLVDPNKHCFSRVVRLVAYVLKFIHATRESVNNKQSKEAKLNILKNTPINFSDALLNDIDIKRAEDHYFQIASKEVKHFVSEKTYSKFSVENERGVLIYTGRILPEDGIQFVTPMTDAMLDLSMTTFFVPVINKHSPIAFSIASDIRY